MSDGYWKALVPYIPLLGAIVAAGVAIYAAILSRQAARATIARDHLQNKIASLTGALAKLYEIDILSPSADYGDAVAADQNTWRHAGRTLMREWFRIYGRLRSCGMSIAHYLSPERQAAVSKALNSAGKTIHKIAETLAASPQNGTSMKELTAPFNESLKDISLQLQLENEDAVQRLEREGGIKRR